MTDSAIGPGRDALPEDALEVASKARAAARPQQRSAHVGP